MTIDNYLRETTILLKNSEVHPSRLDAELLLCHVLDVERDWLQAHYDDELLPEMNVKLNDLVKRRLNHEPIAYITGRKEFYGRDFTVNQHVLIPRPETEDVIDLAKQYTPFRGRALDVGTGSGCIGITIKLERPDINMTICDISEKALSVARHNASKLAAKPLRYVASDLLSHWLSHKNPAPFDIIVANLPYVAKTWPTSPETQHEPPLALYAEDDGLELIFRLINQSTSLLSPSGYLLLEADPEQHDSIIEYAGNYNLSLVEQRAYAVLLARC